VNQPREVYFKPFFTFVGYVMDMSNAVTNDLMYEVLKKIQIDVSSIKLSVADHSRLLNRMREDELRLESMDAGILLRLDRIERRFGLCEPTPT